MLNAAIVGLGWWGAYIEFSGKSASIFARTTKRVVAFESGDVLSIQVRFKSGMLGYISSIIATPFYTRFHLFGSEGWAVIRDLVRNGDLPSEIQQDPSAWNTSVGGVLGEQALKDAVETAGFEQITLSHHREFFPLIAIRLKARKPARI